MSEMDPTAAGTNPAGSAKQMIGEAGQTVKTEAANFASQAQEKVAGQIQQRAEAGAETLGQFAQAIRKAGDELAQNDQSMVSRFVVQAADGLENFSHTLANKRPEELLDSVRELGRRNPTAFIAGAVIAGLAIGRFMRASSDGQSRSVEPYQPQISPPQARTYYGSGSDPGTTTSLESQVGGDMSSGGSQFGAPGADRSRFDPGV